ncbi:MAG: apolipoprotein N-acyltransferase [Planctomycetota bacterium]|jgi:apolipoprotein N-acyltransferase
MSRDANERPDRAKPVRYRGLCCGAASGVLAALAFHPADLPLLAWLALLPLLVHVRAARGGHVGMPFLVFGLLYFSVGLSWLNPVITVVGTVLLSLLLSVLFVWPAGHALGFLLRRGFPWLACVPLTWVAFDWIRTWLFSGFPWLFLAHSQADWLALIQVSALTGAYGVTGLVVLVNAVLTEALFALKRGSARGVLVPVGIASALVGATLGYGFWRIGDVRERPGPRVLLVQANFPQFMKLEALKRGVPRIDRREQMFVDHIRLTERGLEEDPSVDVVIWAETMFPIRMTDEPGLEAEEVRHLARYGLRRVSGAAGGRPVILGAPYITRKSEPRNSVFLIDGMGSPVARYDKLHLVPGGEYIPLRTLAPDGLVRWVGGIIEANAGYVPNLTEGSDVVVFEAAGARFAPLICFEIMFPAICRAPLAKDADILLNITNYGWFPDTDEPDQAQQMAVFRAVETRRPVVVSANTGISAVVSAKGTYRALEVDGRVHDVAGVMAETVPLSDTDSRYVAWGDLPAAIAAGLVLLGLLVGTVVRQKREARVTG